MKKKIIIIVSLLLSLLIGGTCSYFIFNSNKNDLLELPKPEVTGGERGLLGIDKNINEESLDNYLLTIVYKIKVEFTNL